MRFVVPTSTRRAPLASRMSGIRNEPPISTSSPRDSRTSRPDARLESARASAAALLLTTRAASAPVRARTRFSDTSTAVAATPRIEAHLQVAVGVETIGQVGHDFAGQRRPAQVGVEEDAGRVEHAPERRRLGLQRGADAIRDLADPLRQLVVLDSGPDLGPHRVENAGRLDPQRFPSV